MYLYRIYDNNKPLEGYHRAAEAKKIMGTNLSVISTYAENGLTYKGRYRVERFTLKEVEELEEAARKHATEQAARQKRQEEIDKNGASIWFGYLQFCDEFLKGEHHDRRNNEACAREAAGEI